MRTEKGIFVSDQHHERRIHLIQGEFQVSNDPSVVFTTLLGSCVAACIWDPDAKVGGMNHFLLPGQDSTTKNQEAERYGVHLMELLLNGLLKAGARRQRLQAKLFGGGKTMEGLTDVGAKNASFAERFLHNEGMTLVGKSLRGDQGRRIQFWPVSGRARQVFLNADKVPAKIAIPAGLLPVGGGVEFF
jgi:chemotaxis protein CheD